MSYYDSDCFWTHEELGRKVIEQDPRSQGLLSWLKQLLVYVVDFEDQAFAEVQNLNDSQASDHTNDDIDDHDGFRVSSAK